jgi:hypothetical protein
MKRSLILGCFLIIAGMMTANASSVISGTVYDSTGTTALDSIRVALERAGSQSFIRDTTGTDGIFSITTDSTGTFVLKFSSLGTTTYTTRYDTIVLTADHDTTGIVITMKKGSTTTNTYITVKGTVEDSANAGTGIAAKIIMKSSSMGGMGTSTSDTIETTDGSFTIDSAVVGYTLTVSSTGYTSKTHTIVEADTSSLVISLAATVTSSISGTIDSAGSATLISGAIVTLRSSGTATSTSEKDTTGADGTYSFASVSTGIYTISVSATGYTTKSVTDTVTATAGTVNISLVATVTSSISGTIDSAGSGTVISGAIVTLRSSGTGAGTSVKDTTGTDGTYSFASVSTGIYTISVSATGYTTKSVTDTVTATAGTVNISLTATVAAKTITISGTVSDSSGNKLDSVYVAFRSIGTTDTTGGAIATSGTTLLKDTTGTDGAFSFSSTYLSGKYVLRLINLKAATDTLWDTITLDSSNLGVTIVWGKSITTGVAKIRTGVKTSQDVSFANGILKLSNMNSAGSVRLFNAKGELMVMQSFQPGANVNMQIGRKLSMGNYILRITQKNAVIQKRIVVQ